TTLSRVGLDFNAVAQALSGQNQSGQAGYRFAEGQLIPVQAGRFIDSTETLRQLIVADVDGKPVRLEQIATVHDSAVVPSRYVWSRQAGGEAAPAVTLAITKKAGE